MIDEIIDAVGKWKTIADAVRVSHNFRDEIGATLIQLK